MAFTASAVSDNGLNRSQSLGPNKMQIMNWTAGNGDTSGTITADALSEVFQIIVTGCTQTAAPTYSGNTATIAFTDPAATVYGQIVCIGV